MTRAIAESRLQLGGCYIKNSSFEVQPSFAAATSTNNRWIDGSAAGSTSGDTPGWATFVVSGTASAQFDSSDSHSGQGSIKLSCAAASSQVQIAPLPSLSASNTPRYAIPVQPNTSYSVSFWMRTSLTGGSASSGAGVLFREVQGNGTTTGNANSLGSIKTTTGWTKYTTTITTGASTAFIVPILRVTGNDGAGTLIMDAWFDDISIAQPFASRLIVS